MNLQKYFCLYSILQNILCKITSLLYIQQPITVVLQEKLHLYKGDHVQYQTSAQELETAEPTTLEYVPGCGGIA